QTQPHPPEITTDAAAQNSKPAENQTTTHGGARQSSKISTNQKTIGINKLGTLLSSQTTDTNGTTTNPTGPLDRSEATFQTYTLSASGSNR
ncbi:hypothetical protein ACIPY1_07115, partial [Paenarthrobacter nicotinovorans]|uniref:hypothetical protein n=2 Tax=Paenarthrobacter nicotinovorans TaxID=29320 RepID=UPI00382DFBF9